MGFRISAILSKADPDTLLAKLGMFKSGEVDEMPDSGHWCCYIYPNGWTLAYFDDFNFIETVQDRAIELSEVYPTFGMRVHETVMTAQVSGYSNGEVKWGVDWIGEEGPELANLTTFGQVPESFKQIRDKALKAQEADTSVDYLFDVPLAMLELETGFRHDLWLERNDVDHFRIIEPAQSESRSFLSWIFGDRS